MVRSALQEIWVVRVLLRLQVSSGSSRRNDGDIQFCKAFEY